jgi:hypothetical protein
MVQAAIGLKGARGKKGSLKKSKSMEFSKGKEHEPGTKSTATLTSAHDKYKSKSKLHATKSPGGTLTKQQQKDIQHHLQAAASLVSPKGGQRSLGHDRAKIAIVVDGHQERKNSLGSGNNSGNNSSKDGKEKIKKQFR